MVLQKDNRYVDSRLKNSVTGDNLYPLVPTATSLGLVGGILLHSMGVGVGGNTRQLSGVNP